MDRALGYFQVGAQILTVGMATALTTVRFLSVPAASRNQDLLLYRGCSL